MQTEIEAKFLNIDKDKIRAKLIKLGAKLQHPERLMSRAMFDYPDWRLEKIGGWIRVRNEGNKITLSYKQLNNRTLHGTKEMTVIVDDFNTTCELFKTIGLEQKSYQETKRESWKLRKIEIEIDEWPWIPPFIEIEAKSEKEVKDMAAKLGFDWKEALHGSVEIVYQQHYKVTEQEIDHWDSITFVELPDWLESTRINKS
ncbi:MAG: class IV adenylate cyclase [Candidatus Saccharibacteria bacterium]